MTTWFCLKGANDPAWLIVYLRLVGLWRAEAAGLWIVAAGSGWIGDCGGGGAVLEQNIH